MKHHSTTRHLLAATAVLASSALLLTACSKPGSDTSMASAAPTTLEGTVSFWHFFSDREADAIQAVVDDFEAANPGVTVDVHPGQDDEKLRKAISAGTTVDLGLYYNVDLLEAAGYTTPPKTLTELKEMALALTTYNTDGSIKTLGFNPMMGFYENSAAHYGPLAAAHWLNEDGTSAISTSPGWVELMEWQKGFVDEIGYDKLNAFTAGLGQEFSGDNAFHTGQIAMNLDGEYRTAFIDDQAPDLNYATAPMPVIDSQPDLYGAGYITGNIAGISKGSKNPELAWALLKYLTTTTDAIVKLSNGLKNVPVTTDAIASPNLEVSDQFQTFLDITKHPQTKTTPPSPVGAGYQQSFEDFWHTYQTSGTDDLQASLVAVDKEINDALALTTGP